MKRRIVMITVAFLLRFVAAGVTTVTNLNPESLADAEQFGSTAAFIANGLIQGQLLFPDVSITYQKWGLFLAPFWLLPGPSGFYARVGNALLGAFAIYNVYVIARYYHSDRAGLIAAIPMIVYPSFIAVHSTMLREAFVLFGITTAARFFLIPTSTRNRLLSYVLAGGFLWLAWLHRDDNAIIFAAAIIAGLVANLIETKRMRPIAVAGALLSPIAILYSLPDIRDGIRFLARIREVRGFGRTVYLAETIPTNLPELIAFSWVGAIYFLYAPFPWMIGTPEDLVVGLEGIVSLVFSIAGIYGVKILYHKSRVVTVGLLVGLLVAVVLYGVGTVNFGTAMRHRQMFLWVVFLFGGIGIAERFKFTGFPNRS